MLIVTYQAIGTPPSRIVTRLHWLRDDLSALVVCPGQMCSGLRRAAPEPQGATSRAYRLTSLDEATLDDEVVGAANRLEQAAGVAVRHFAYLYGLYGAREVSRARLRFRTALTTIARLVGHTSDPHTLGRIDAHDLHVAARLPLLGAPGILAPYLAARRGLRALVR